MKPLHLLTALLAAAALAACGGSLPQGRTLELTAVEMAFEPAELRAAPGEPIFIRFLNRGTQAHNLTAQLAASDRQVSVDAGQDAVLAIPPQPAGRYALICRIPGHEAQRAVLVVE